MDLVERLVLLIVGGGIGFVLGYIVRSLRDIEEKVDHISEHEHPSKDEGGFMRYPILADIMYLLVLFIVLWAAYQTYQVNQRQLADDREDEISRCEAGVDSRNVQRALVDAVYNLATGVIRTPMDPSSMTAAEVDEYNNYVERVNEFRNETYNQIKPSEACEPYVEDDNVEPPTKPFPTIPELKE